VAGTGAYVCVCAAGVGYTGNAALVGGCVARDGGNVTLSACVDGVAVLNGLLPCQRRHPP
jgi:hypothetical protein